MINQKQLTADAIVSNFNGDSTTIKERFSGGGGESEDWFIRLFISELLDEPVCDESDNKALAAVRLIPLLLLVQGTAADCILLYFYTNSVTSYNSIYIYLELKLNFKKNWLKNFLFKLILNIFLSNLS